MRVCCLALSTNTSAVQPASTNVHVPASDTAGARWPASTTRRGSGFAGPVASCLLPSAALGVKPVTLGAPGVFVVSAWARASNPGPGLASPDTNHPRPPSASERPALRRRVAAGEAGVRVFCPVPSCGMHDPDRCSGWGSHPAMRNHLDDHCSGVLSGQVPQQYLDAHNLEPCTVCGLLVKRFHNGSHPRCRPASRASATSRPARLESPDSSLPSFSEIMSSGWVTLRHVPKAARATWAQCLARAVATAVGRNTVAAWQELLLLPKAVLVAPRRGGARHRAQAAQAVRRRCSRWLDGERAELWEDLGAAPPRRTGTDLTRDSRHRRCKRLAAEGDFARACSALIEPPPLPPSQETLAELRAKHPAAAPVDLASLDNARPGAVPEFDAEAVAQAIRSFKHGSAPGPSGL